MTAVEIASSSLGYAAAYISSNSSPLMWVVYAAAAALALKILFRFLQPSS